MAEESISTFLQLPIISKFLLPFLLVFFIIFAVLEKTKIFGDKSKQINALTAFVIGLIFVGAIYPKLVVNNLILFLTVTIVGVFVVLLIWGFIFGRAEGFQLEKWMRWILGVVVTIIIVWGIIWAVGLSDKIGTFFAGDLGQTIITNGIFILVIAVALALILIPKK